MKTKEKRIQLFTKLTHSGAIHLTVGKIEKVFSVFPEILNGEKIGVFYADNKEELEFVKSSPHFESGMIWKAKDEISIGSTPVLADPEVKTVEINPLGLSKTQVIKLNNAMVINPAIADILRNNIEQVCDDILGKADSVLEAGMDGPVVLEKKELEKLTVAKLKAVFAENGVPFDEKKDKAHNISFLLKAVSDRKKMEAGNA